MLRRVNAAATLAVALLLLAALRVSPAAAEQENAPPSVDSTVPEKGYERLFRDLRGSQWQPSLAVTSGVSFQIQKAQASSTIDETGRPTVSPGDILLEPGSGEDWAVSPYVGVNAELMTPALPGGIRFFVNGEYLPTFGADLDVQKVGDPSGLEVPVESYSLERFCDPNVIVSGAPGNPWRAGCNCPYGFGCFSEEAITGAGTKTTATMGRDVFGAAVGVALPFEMFGRKLMLKPSVGWIHYQVDVAGTVLRGIKSEVDVGTGNSPRFRGLPVTRFVQLSDSATPGFNAIGPGLELEMEVHQVGPVETSLFLDAHGYRVVGSRKVKLSDTTSRSCGTDPIAIAAPPGQPVQPGVQRFLCSLTSPFPGVGGTVQPNQFGPGEGVYSADWSFKVDPWLYRVGLGLRFRWTGEQ